MYPKITQAPEGIDKNRWLDLSVTNEQHHSFKCISSSHLKFLAEGESLFSYHQKFIAKTIPYESKDAFTTGTLAHLAILEPETFEKKVKVCDIDQRTTEFKEYIKNLILNNSDEDVPLFLPPDSKTAKKKVKDDFKIQYTKDGGILNKDGEEIFIVKPKEMEMFRTFQKRVDDHKRLNVWLPACTIEQTGVAQDPVTGMWLSLRGDARCERGFFLDPKTIDKRLTEKGLIRYAQDYHLAIQAVHYLNVANLIEGTNSYSKFFFVMLSKTPPFEVCLFQFDEETLHLANKKWRSLLNTIAQCEERNYWPSLDYSDGLHGLKLKLPPWGLA